MLCVSYYTMRALYTNTHSHTLYVCFFDDKSYMLPSHFLFRYIHTQEHICILRMVFLHGRKFIKIIILWAWHILSTEIPRKQMSEHAFCPLACPSQPLPTCASRANTLKSIQRHSLARSSYKVGMHATHNLVHFSKLILFKFARFRATLNRMLFSFTLHMCGCICGIGCMWFGNAKLAFTSKSRK